MIQKLHRTVWARLTKSELPLGLIIKLSDTLSFNHPALRGVKNFTVLLRLCHEDLMRLFSKIAVISKKSVVKSGGTQTTLPLLPLFRFQEETDCCTWVKSGNPMDPFFPTWWENMGKYTRKHNCHSHSGVWGIQLWTQLWLRMWSTGSGSWMLYLTHHFCFD